MYIDLVSHNDFPSLAIPLPASLDSYTNAIQTVYHYIGKYADRINGINATEGFEARQRFLFMLIQLVFSWSEKKLSIETLSAEISNLIEWAETH